MENPPPNNSLIRFSTCIFGIPEIFAEVGYPYTFLVVETGLKKTIVQSDHLPK